MPSESYKPDLRWQCNGKVRLSLAWPVAAICLSLFASSWLIANAIHTRPLLRLETPEPPLARVQHVPCDAQAGQIAGPFRPRPPKPIPPDPPAPVPENDAERKLFPRIEALIEARAARVEARAEARAEQAVNAALEEVASGLDSVRVDDSGVVTAQGAFGSLIAAKLADLIKRVVAASIKILIRVVIGELVMSHIGWIVGGLVGLLVSVWGVAWAAGRIARKAA